MDLVQPRFIICTSVSLLNSTASTRSYLFIYLLIDLSVSLIFIGLFSFDTSNLLIFLCHNALKKFIASFGEELGKCIFLRQRERGRPVYIKILVK